MNDSTPLKMVRRIFIVLFCTSSVFACSVQSKKISPHVFGEDTWSQVRAEIQQNAEVFCAHMFDLDYELHERVKGHEEEFVTQLIEANVDINSEWPLSEVRLDFGDVSGVTLLSFSAHYCGVSLMRALLGAGAQASSVVYFGKDSPLHSAVSLRLGEGHDQIEKVKLLLDSGALVTAENSYGQTPLMIAQEEEMIKVLIEYGKADVNYRSTRTGRTLLHMHHVSSKEENNNFRFNSELVGYLLAKGANYNVQDNKGNTPFLSGEHWLCECIALARDKGVSIDLNIKNLRGETLLSQNYFLIFRLASYEAVEFVACLLRNGAHYNQITTNLFEVATLADDPQSLESLLESSARRNDDLLGVALHCAVLGKRLKCLTILLKYGADKNYEYKGLSPLGTAVWGHSAECVRVLCEAGANVEFQVKETEKDKLLFAGDRLLHVCASSVSTNILNILLDYGANRDAEDSEGRSVLSRSIIEAHDAQSLAGSIVLVERGAQVHAYDRQRVTPLLHLLKNKTVPRKDLVKVLLDKGAHIQDKDDEGNTPLCEAFLKRDPNDFDLESEEDLASLLIENCFRSFMPSDEEVSQSRERIYAAIQCMTRCKIALYLQVDILLCDKDQVEKDVIFLYLGHLKKGKPCESILLISAKDSVVRYLVKKLTPVLRDVRARLTKGSQGHEAVRNFDAILPRVPTLIQKGIYETSSLCRSMGGKKL